MILAVEGERADRSTLADALDADDSALVSSVEEARSRLESTSPSALLLAGPLDGDAGTLIGDVRAGRFCQPGMPIVAVVGDDDRERAVVLGVDETVETPASVDALESAIERAILLGQYKAAVNEFFDACREHVEGSAPGERRGAARRTADEYLEEIHSKEIPFECLI